MASSSTEIFWEDFSSIDWDSTVNIPTDESGFVLKRFFPNAPSILSMFKSLLGVEEIILSVNLQNYIANIEAFKPIIEEHNFNILLYTKILFAIHPRCLDGSGDSRKMIYSYSSFKDVEGPERVHTFGKLYANASGLEGKEKKKFAKEFTKDSKLIHLTLLARIPEEDGFVYKKIECVYFSPDRRKIYLTLKN